MNCFLDARSKIFYLEGLILAEQQHLAVTTGDRDPDIALQNETWHNEELRQQLLIAETALARLATKVADAEAMREQNLAHVARTRDQTAILADYKAWRKQRGAGAGGGGLGGKMQGLGRSEKALEVVEERKTTHLHATLGTIRVVTESGLGEGKQEDTISKQQKRTASTDDPSYHWIMRTGKPATNAEEPDSAAKSALPYLENTIDETKQRKDILPVLFPPLRSLLHLIYSEFVVEKASSPACIRMTLNPRMMNKDVHKHRAVKRCH